MDQDFKRFSQRVRSEIRKHVVREREAPGLTLWVSLGADPRKIADARVGAAASAADVALNIREHIMAAEAKWAAVGRLLADVTDGLEGLDGTPFTQTFGLVVADRDMGVRAWAVDIRAGVCEAWREADNPDQGLVMLLTSSLRAARPVVEEHERAGGGVVLRPPSEPGA